MENQIGRPRPRLLLIKLKFLIIMAMPQNVPFSQNILRPCHHYQKFYQQQEALVTQFDFTSRPFLVPGHYFFIPGVVWLRSSFTIDHTMVCPFGGFPTITHNEIRVLTASLLTEVSYNVAIEPSLQPVTTETFSVASANITNDACLDIKIRGF